jgi:hypothetical protein
MEKGLNVINLVEFHLQISVKIVEGPDKFRTGVPITLELLDKKFARFI